MMRRQLQTRRTWTRTLICEEKTKGGLLLLLPREPGSWGIPGGQCPIPPLSGAQPRRSFPSTCQLCSVSPA